MTTTERRLLFGALALNVAYVFFRNADTTPYDDSYFFKRFALQFLEHGQFSWNAADGPVHGLTSQLFQIVATGLTALAPAHFVLAAKAFLALCLVLGAVLFAELAARMAARTDVAVGVTLLVFGCPLLFWTPESGMETALASLVLVACFRALFAPETRRHHAAEAAGLTALAYLCRPDIALLPFVSFVVASARERQRLVTYLASLAVLLGTLLVLFRVYYGTALPLPFYMKTLGFSPYDAAFRELGARDKLVHVATFAAFGMPLVFLSRPRGDTKSLGLVVASAAFVAYHAVATDEIMGYRARFYAPALVPLGLAAARGASRALATPRARSALFFGAWALAVAAGYHFGFVSSAASSPLEKLPAAAYLACGALFGWVAFSGDAEKAPRAPLGGALVLFFAGTLASLPPRRGGLPDDRQFLRKSSAEVTTTRGLFDLERCLPNLGVLYHSEIGVPGLVFPRTRVTDLAGLMSRSIALEHPRFDEYCGKERPEAIFLPHRAYAALNREILASACLEGYTNVVRQSSSPLYVRNDLAPRFLGCARDVAAWR